MTGALDFLASPHAGALPPDPAVALLPDDDAPRRLTVVVPHVFSRQAFGGLHSALELSREMSRQFEAIRVVSMHPPLADAPDEPVHAAADFALGPARNRAELVFLADDPLPCRRDETFLCTYWTTVLVWEAFARALDAAGQPRVPFHYFIQDFEPGFYQFGAKYMACLATYRHGDHCRALFNSRSLADYFAAQGLSFSQARVLTPALNPVLRATLDALGWTATKDPSFTSLAIYGRPEQPRNCFAVIVEGLRRYVATLPPARRARLRLVSAGKPHEHLRLADDVVLVSLGRLALRDYAALLAGAHVGIAMMASPHPSYPPLEMAAFGLQTLTNDFAAKRLAGAHPNLTSLPLPTPAAIAAALPDLVARADALAGRPQALRLPDGLSPDPWPVVARRAVRGEAAPF